MTQEGTMTPTSLASDRPTATAESRAASTSEVDLRGAEPSQHIVDPETGCWIWQGQRNAAGYAIDGRQKMYRVYYERHVGPIPEGLVIDHICMNGPGGCVNPDHLRAITQGQNSQNRKPISGPGFSSQYRGVSWDKTTRRWQAHARVNGKLHQLGRFDTERAAALAASRFRAEHMPFSSDARGVEVVASMGRDEALARGQRLRIAGAQRKREIRALSMAEGLVAVADLLENPPEEIRSVKVSDLLRSIRAVGPAKVKRMLNKAGVLPGAGNRYVGPSDRNPTITPGQRVRIADVLRNWS